MCPADWGITEGSGRWGSEGVMGMVGRTQMER